MLMVAYNAISSLNFSESEKSEELQPLDFTMSKFKSSSPSKHPLYYQFYGSNSAMSPNRDIKQENQGRWQLSRNRTKHPFTSVVSPSRTRLSRDF